MATYTLISSNVLSSSAASVTFSSIPATYTDLVVRASVRRSAAGRTDFDFYFNTNNTDNSYTYIRGSGSAANSNSGGTIIKNNDTVPSTSETASTFGSIEIYIPNYVGTALKPVSIFGVGENNATTAYITATAGLWSFGAATITTITMNPVTGSFVSGSSFYLYGVSNA
jgi:hypothetical protein